jgi:hypothetical protein
MVMGCMHGGTTKWTQKVGRVGVPDMERMSRQRRADSLSQGRQRRKRAEMAELAREAQAFRPQPRAKSKKPRPYDPGIGDATTALNQQG